MNVMFGGRTSACARCVTLTSSNAYAYTTRRVSWRHLRDATAFRRIVESNYSIVSTDRKPTPVQTPGERTSPVELGSERPQFGARRCVLDLDRAVRCGRGEQRAGE